MREVGAIRHKFKQVRYRHLKRRIEEALEVTPANCAHNRMFHHPTVAASSGPPIGICACPAQDGDLLCDAAWGGNDRARLCPMYQASTTKDEVKQAFTEFLAAADLHVIAKEYPDLAALLWVLQEEAPDRNLPATEDDNDAPPTPAKPVFQVTVAGRVLSTDDETLARTMGEIERESQGVRTALAKAQNELAEVPPRHEPPPEVPVKPPWWRVWLGRWLA